MFDAGSLLAWKGVDGRGIEILRIDETNMKMQDLELVNNEPIT